MSVEIKFCGLTRAADARYAAELGAAYAGVIFAGGPRALSAERAGDVLRDVPRSVRRVGVFADQNVSEIARLADELALDVIQLHGGASVSRLEAVRSVVAVAVWPVVRVTETLPPDTAALAQVADALLLDAFVPTALGGAGVAFAWQSIAGELQAMRGNTRIVLAGGLRPENVAEAIATLGPDVVDVSSGVESSPGIKDHERMRAFRDAVMQASIPT